MGSHESHGSNAFPAAEALNYNLPEILDSEFGPPHFPC